MVITQAVDVCDNSPLLLFGGGRGLGEGLGYQAKKARRVVGSDYTASLLCVAR